MSAVAVAGRVESAGAAMSAWFVSVADLSAKAFGWNRDRHGDAAALHVLRRQAARLRSARLAEDGTSYTTLYLFLASGCRALNLRLETRHWVAALRNVSEQRGLALDNKLGVVVGTPAERFKLLLDDAIDVAGLGVQMTTLDERNQKVALGLALNWGVRTLLAYAAEASRRRARGSRDRHDLAWIRSLVL